MSKHWFTAAEYALERVGQRAFYPVAVTGDFTKAYLQVRVGPKERDAFLFHCLKNLDTTAADTLRFTRALFGLAPSPFLLAGVIEHHLEGQSKKTSRDCK